MRGISAPGAMFRCVVGRRRHTYLYLGVLLVFLLALLQSFIADMFRVAVPGRYCGDRPEAGMCVRVDMRAIVLSRRNASSSVPVAGGDTAVVAPPETRSSRDVVDAGDAAPGTEGVGGAPVVSRTAAGDRRHVVHRHFGGEEKSQIRLSVAASAPASLPPRAPNAPVYHRGGASEKPQGVRVPSAPLQEPAAFSGSEAAGWVPRWQRRLAANSTAAPPVRRPFRYFLVELLQVRIYDEDKARWTVRELKQWMHFLFLAGVEHVYLCDHHQEAAESLRAPLRRYIERGLVTYIPWRDIAHPMTAQVECYQYIIDTYGNQTRFQMAIDMDEYPYSPVDFGEGFLPRYLRNISGQGYGHRVSEISMNNYLMLGQGDRSRDMVISRINRMTPKPANHLVKPIFKPERVRAGLHHNYIRRGVAIYANDTQLRMLHYWGARLQNWERRDSDHVRNMTVVMDRMREGWAGRLRASLVAFGEMDAFSSDTGP